MALTIVIVACFIAGATADLQFFDLPNLRCSEKCDTTSSTKLSYEIGMTYGYKYSGRSMVTIAGLEQGITKSEFKANVDLTWLNPCDVLMRIKDAKVDGVESHIMASYPTVISFINGNLEKICTHPKDDTESVNMKRGIASSMQNSLSELTSSSVTHILDEEDIIGKCSTAYTVEAKGETLIVTKEKDHNKCKNNHIQLLNIPLIKTQFKIYDSKSQCRQEITNKIYTNIRCKDTNIVNPIPGVQEFTLATIETSLTFTFKDTNSNNLQSVADITLVQSPLNYDYNVFKEEKIVGDIDNTFSYICVLIQSKGMPEVTSSVARVIILLRQAPSYVIAETLQKIRKKEYCSNFKKLEGIFLDVIAYIGKPGSISIIAEEIAANRVTGGRLPIYVASLYLLNNPSEDILMSLMPILLMNNPDSTAILSTASVINKYCKNNLNCMETEPMKNIMNIISKKLKTQCTLEFNSEHPKEILVSLKALANIGSMTPEVAANVLECVKIQEMEPSIHFTAAMVLRKAPCLNSVKNTLFDMVFNPLISAEIRIASYLATINCISDDDIDDILMKVTHITDTYVYSFIISHLLNLKKTSWPTKRHLHDLLSSKNIPSLYQRNILRQSQNLQMAYNSPILGSGIELESNIITNENSYIPKFMNLDVNMNFVGSVVNIGEIGTVISDYDVNSEGKIHENYLSTLDFNTIMDELLAYVRKDDDYALQKLESQTDKRLLSSILKHMFSHKIQLPKTELYAKLFDQEIFFFSPFGDRKELKISDLVQIFSLSIQNILDSIKNVDIDAARAGQIRLHHIIPTIQGLPLTVSAEATVLASVNLKSKYSKKDVQFEGNLKFAPSFSFQIDGYIGFGQNIKNGIKMKTVIYTTNGLYINIKMRDNQALDINFNLPDKMELLNIKSEVYPLKSIQKGQEQNGLVTDLQDVRYARDQCLDIIESFTGLHICYKINLPNLISQNGISISKPVLLKLFLQKSDESMTGYHLSARFKNTNAAKSMKINFGMAGVSIPREINLKLSHTIKQNNDISISDLNFQSTFLKMFLEVTAIDKDEQTSLIFFGDAKYETQMGEKSISGVLRTEMKQKLRPQKQQYEMALYTAQSKNLENERQLCYIETLFENREETTTAKFSTNIDPLAMSLNSKVEFKIQSIPGFWIPKLITIGNVDISISMGSVKIETQVIMASNAQYQSSFTLLYQDHIILALNGAHHINGNLRNFIFDTNVGVRIGTSEWSSTTYFTYDDADHMEALIKLVRPDNSRVFYIKVKYDINGNTRKTNIVIYIPGIMEPVKASFSLENIDSYSYSLSSQIINSFNITSKIIHGDSVYLQIEGPIVIELFPDKILHNFDLKIIESAAFDGSHHFKHTLILSPNNVQFVISLEKEVAHLFSFDLNMARDGYVDSLQIDFYLAHYVKSQIVANMSSMTALSSLDVTILPNPEPFTSVSPSDDYKMIQNKLSRRVKGNLNFNIETQEFKGELYWDVENDKDKKMSIFTTYNYDVIDHHITINGDLLLFSKTYSYKFTSVLASPSNWFSGDNGIELFITLPTNAVFTWKTKCKVLIEDSTLTLTPLLFIQLMNNDQYKLIGSLKLKNIQNVHNLEINTEWNLSLPGIEHVKLTNNFIQNIAKDSYKYILKTDLGETMFNDVIKFEILSDSKSGKYSNMVKLKFGAHPTEIITTITRSSQATDIHFAVTPFISTNSLTIKLAKIKQNINLAILKDEMTYVKLQFIKATPTSFVFLIQLPSRTVKIQSMIYNRQFTIDIYPEKNKSDRILEVKIVPTIISGVGHFKTYIKATSMQNAIDVSSIYAIYNSNENIINFDMNYPVKDIKNLTKIINKELEVIYQEIKNEGLFTELKIIISNLKNIINDIPTSIKPYINKLRIFSRKSYNRIQEGISNLYKIYETDISLLWKQFLNDIDSYWNIAEENMILFIKPVIHFIKNSNVLQRISEEINLLGNQYPVAYNIIIDFYDKVIKTYISDITKLYTKIKYGSNNDVQHIIEELKKELYIVYQHFHEQLLDTKLLDIIQANIDYLKEQYPLLNEISMKFFSKNKEFVEENINLVYERIMDTNPLESVQISSIYTKLLKIIKDNISWKSIIGAVRSFIHDNLSLVHSMTNDHITASLQLPISVPTLYNTWEFLIYQFPALLTDIITNMHTVINTNILPYVEYIKEDAPQYMKNIINYIKTATHIIISIISNLSKLVMDTESIKTLQSKIQELIENYPSEIIEALFNWATGSVNEYTMWLTNDIADIPYVKKTLKYIEHYIILPFMQFISTFLHIHNPVRVHLYYETMCPYSKQFVVEQLYPTWKELGDIMEIEMFPFGNAKYEPSGSGGWKFTCQHGPDECKANMIHACAKNKFKDINIEMDFVNCLEAAEQPAQAGANCSVNIGMAWGPIEACISSLEGQILLHDVALRQEKLQPKVKYVPWVIINNHWSEEMEDASLSNLKKVVCEVYGAVRPECDQIPNRPLQVHRRTYS